MQNGSRLVERFKLAAREAKASRASGMTLLEQTRFILLVAGRQARNRRAYVEAYEYDQVLRMIRGAHSLRVAYQIMLQPGAHETSSAEQTPASNTGVTNAGATVPIDFFTRGK